MTALLALALVLLVLVVPLERTHRRLRHLPPPTRPNPCLPPVRWS